MRLRELAFALLAAGSIAAPASARDVGELQCVHAKAAPDDAKLAYDAVLSGQAAPLVDRMEKLMLGNIACFNDRGLTEHVGEVAGNYISASLTNDHVVLQLRGVPNALSILDNALAKMTDEQKGRIPSNITDADKAWFAQVEIAAGLAGDQTRSMQARLYIICQVQMSRDIAEWKTL